MSDPSAAACPAEITNTCAQRHWAIYWILIVCSVAMVGGRVLTVPSRGAHRDLTLESPFFSANDRSRWSTIRALGDDGNFEIDDVIEDPGNSINWDSIDKVRHTGADGNLHYYSSKPVLFPTLLAGIYISIKQVTGWTLADDTILVARTMLVLVNVVPWLIYLWVFGLLIDRIPVRDWTRYYVLAVACFGTFLSTFVITINNHLPAAISVMIALFCLTRVWREDMRLDENGQYVARKFNAPWLTYFLAGVFGAFAAANELPALSFLVLAGLICLVRSPIKTMSGFVPGMAIVMVGFFMTNYWAHGEWQPAYAHRSDGKVLRNVEGGFSNQLDDGLDDGGLPKEIRAVLPPELEMSGPHVAIGMWPGTSEHVKRWVVRDRNSARQFAITREKTGTKRTGDGDPNGNGVARFQILQWNNWYDYPGSYWLTSNDRKSLVDRGQPSRVVYAFHILFGHHGLFSLTPVWILSFAGMLGLMFKTNLKLRWLGWLTLMLTVVVLGFYLVRPELDRNYGGVTSGLRWLFWLAPLWLVSMLPVVDWLGRTGYGRFVCFLLFGLSVISAIYSSSNPWVHPWLYEIWDLTGLPF